MVRLAMLLEAKSGRVQTALSEDLSIVAGRKDASPRAKSMGALRGCGDGGHGLAVPRRRPRRFRIRDETSPERPRLASACNNSDRCTNNKRPLTTTQSVKWFSKTLQQRRSRTPAQRAMNAPHVVVTISQGKRVELMA